jgi:hypothetical protein
MTTAEVTKLESEFRQRGAADPTADSVWRLAAALLIDAESRSLTASMNRNRKRRNAKLGLRLNR